MKNTLKRDQGSKTHATLRNTNFYIVKLVRYVTCYNKEMMMMMMTPRMGKLGREQKLQPDLEIGELGAESFICFICITFLFSSLYLKIYLSSMTRAMSCHLRSRPILR